MMSRCWLFVAPRLTIEPSSTSARGSVSISENRLLPIARARSFDACGNAGSLYWASVTSPGSAPMPSFAGPAELAQTRLKL